MLSVYWGAPRGITAKIKWASDSGTIVVAVSELVHLNEDIGLQICISYNGLFNVNLIWKIKGFVSNVKK
jgi:hypothetical protein